MPIVAIDAALLDATTAAARDNPRRRRNHNFHPTDAYPAHRLLNAIEPDSYIRPHRHLDPNKAESIVAVRGRFGLAVFDDVGRVIQTTVFAPNTDCIGVDIGPGTWHALVALEPGSVFFEAKAGPFLPLADAERAAWAPEEGSELAPKYLRELRKLFG